MQAEAYLLSGFIRKHVDVIIAGAVGGKESHHRVCLQPLLFDQPFEHALRVGVQVARRLADHRIGEQRRKLARELPGIEERHPVDIRHQLIERIVSERFHAEESRHRRSVTRPIDFESLGTRLRQR